MTIRNTFSIPVVPSEFDTFQKTVVPIFIAKAVLYGIPAESLTKLAPKTIKWNAYSLICDTDATAGPGATANRNGYQEEYSNAISIIIEDYLLNNPDITDADALSFHIHLMGGAKTALPVPNSTVLAMINYMEPLAHYFKFSDTKTGKRARPKGVSFVELNYMIGTVPPTTVDDCNKSVFLNRNKNRVQFINADQGKWAYYYGRYVNKHGEVGPWCILFSSVII